MAQKSSIAIKDWRNILSDSADVWREPPVTFRAFATSRKFMAADIDLSNHQISVVERFLGDDPLFYFSDVRTTRLLVLLWGKGCISGDTEIFDPIAQSTHSVKELFDRRLSFHVCGQDSTGDVITCEADPPFIKGVERLYTIKTKSGKVCKVAADHRVLTETRGYIAIRDLQVGERIQVEDD